MRAMSPVLGRSGMASRTSVSTRSWSRLSACQLEPSLWATSGSLSGPSKSSTTATMTMIFIGAETEHQPIVGSSGLTGIRCGVRGQIREEGLADDVRSRHRSPTCDCHRNPSGCRPS